MGAPKVVVEGLAFGEGPRWHDGRLWLSDMHAHQVLAISETGDVEVIGEVPNRPSGLGWLPDGSLLVVSMTDRCVLRLEANGRSSTYADLSGVATFDCNDMVVDGRGHAYVGNFGFDLHGQQAPRPATLALVRLDGSVSAAAPGLQFPNGSVVSADGSTLIVAESFGRCLTSFQIAVDGSLSQRRLWADLDGGVPDGICLDAEGAVWYADPLANRCVRVAQGGRVLQTVEIDRGAFACMLGGPDRKTLYILAASTSDPEKSAAERSSQVLALDVDVPGVGWP